MKLTIILLVILLFAREIAALIKVIRLEDNIAVLIECGYLCGLVVLAKFLGGVL